jgi:hypothetical protein
MQLKASNNEKNIFGEGILNGESPYEYESRSYDHTTGRIDSITFHYSAFSDRLNSVVPAMRIKKV